MTITLDLALRIMESFALIGLAVANGLIAYAVFRIQRDRNTANLEMFVNLVDEGEGRFYNALYVQNVGLVPARHVRIVADVEEWRDGSPVNSQFHEEFQVFEDHAVVLQPLEFKQYELPHPEGWALVITAIAECSNGTGDAMHFVAGDHPPAVRSVAFCRASTKRKAIRAVRNKAKVTDRPTTELYLALNLALLKNSPQMFGKENGWL